MQDRYVSDYAKFIEGFMHEHPEVEDERRSGWLIWWDKPVHQQKMAKEMQEEVPQDGYGFYYNAWVGKTRQPMKKQSK